MSELKRVSPVVFKSTPVKTEKRDHFDVALEYHDEGTGPFLVDLTHRMRLDLQDKNVGAKKPFGMALPKTAGECVFNKGILANRMNGTQVSLWDLAADDVEMPKGSSYTDVMENTIFLALVGNDIFFILEKVSALDLLNPGIDAPHLFQGPVSHVPCQVTVLKKDADDGCVLFTCSRGYAKDMVHALLDAGAEFGLGPAGENRFSSWVKNL